MTRGIIIIEDKTVSVTGNEIWMTAGEIAGLFRTGVPAVNAAIKAISKSDVLNDYEVCHYIQLENGLHADVYPCGPDGASGAFGYPGTRDVVFAVDGRAVSMAAARRVAAGRG